MVNELTLHVYSLFVHARSEWAVPGSYPGLLHKSELQIKLYLNLPSWLEVPGAAAASSLSFASAFDFDSLSLNMVDDTDDPRK